MHAPEMYTLTVVYKRRVDGVERLAFQHSSHSNHRPVDRMRRLVHQFSPSLEGAGPGAVESAFALEGR